MKINVNVSYEQPTTTKFDALMEQYKVAKQIANETVSYYKPLAEAGEEAKMKAILKQLETIEYYCYQLALLKDNKEAEASTIITSTQRGNDYGGLWFSVRCNINSNGTPCYYKKWGHVEFSIEQLKKAPHAFTDKGYNILGNWDKWKVYEELEDNIYYKMRALIKGQEQRGQKQIKRFENIQD